MEIWQSILSIIIVFLGLPLGLIVGYVSKKEIYQGTFYFSWLKRLLIVAGVFVTGLMFDIRIGIVAAVLFFALQYIKLPTWPSYVVWAVALALTTSQGFYFSIIATLAFLFSFPIATEYLATLKKIQTWNKFASHALTLCKRYWVFPILYIILSLFF